MIICLIGTRAQLIKMAPIILELERRQIPLHLVLTGQHRETMEQLFSDFGIRIKRLYLYEGTEITGIAQMGVWFLRCLMKCLTEREKYLPRSKQKRDVILVHGDTFSTLLGAIAGKIRGIKVAHIEAGLRSRNIFHPFPEELTRLAVSRLSYFSFCPGEWAYDNLKEHSTIRVDTHHNTLIEAVDLALKSSSDSCDSRVEEFGVVSIHRFENILNAGGLTRILDLVEKAAEKYPLIFVLHPATRKRLIEFGLFARLESNPNIELVPRMGYIEFVGLLKRAKFVISDGGGNQEELSYLGVPTLLMRKATERQEGLNSTATLCRYDKGVLEQFLANLSRTHQTIRAIETSPSGIIVDTLASYAL
jgi:UDP-N-acetylglucosamine 2-epimerase (non-hydrolysing)